METKSLELLLSKLEDSSCALILGPEFLLADQEEADIVQLIKKFFEDNKFEGTEFLKDDGFFYKTGNSANKITERENLALNISEFYQQQPMHAYYNLLAEMPFNLIISLSPDNFIERAFQKISKPYELLYYQKGDFYRQRKDNRKKFEKIQEEYIPDKNAAIILNLLGLCNKYDFLIITYDDFFKFLAPLLNIVNIKLKLNSLLEDMSSFLFLGFKYNKWYLNFIFFLIQHLQGNREFGKKGVVYFTKDDTDTLDFYEKAFNFEFSREKTGDFIKVLHKRSEEEGLTFVTDSRQGGSDTRVGEKTRIVYIASNPDLLNPIGSDDEYDRIEKVRKSHLNRDSFELVKTKRASTVKDLIQYIDDNKPHVVIISAHGNDNNELLFKDDIEAMVPLSAENLENIFKNLTSRSRNNLECVIFSCCQSEELAEKVKQFVNYAIGMHGPLPVQAAPEFAEGFFQTFFNDKNYMDAFENGKLYIDQYIQGKKELKKIDFRPLMYK